MWSASDGATAIERLRGEQWDALILDRMLPGADGLTVCREAAREHQVPVIFVSALTLEEERLAGFEAGGDDYITKPFSPRELVARVGAVLRRQPTRDPMLRAGELVLEITERRATIGSARLDLTPSEFEILRALVERGGRSVTREALLERLPGHGGDTLPRTIDVHVRNLRRKLAEGAPQSTLQIESVLGVGYRMVVA